MVLLFVAVRRLVIDPGMEPIRIVPALDELNDREAGLRGGPPTGLRPIGERVLLDELPFEGCEEGFLQRVLVAVPN